MRRKDREMSYEFALEIIDEAAFGVMSLASGDEPYGIPLSLVRDGDRLCFHTAREGHKFDFIRDGAPVNLIFVSRVQVPELYSREELEELSGEPGALGKLLSEVFTTEFASAMVKGTIREVMEEADKARCLRLVCQKYTPDHMKYADLAVASGLPLTRVFEISMAEVSAKRKKFDANRVELKFGRSE